MLVFVHRAMLSRFYKLATTTSSHACIVTVVNRMMSGCQDHDEKVVPKDEVIRFIQDCMCKAGTSLEDAYTVGHHLMIADYRGHFSHGMNRMQMYVKDIENRFTDPTARPQIITDFQAIALVDGKNALGQVIGKYCMELAIEKAKKFGIGMVTTRGSNHFGICGYYTMMAMEQGLIGFNCTNTSPLMAPTRSVKAGLGTNPLSLGMATSDGDEFVLDMATTAVALGKIELAIRKGEDIPEGWALDSDGKVTRDAEEAFEASLLMPLGGSEQNSGYKGYGLALMVEILCGILSGSQFGPNIRPWKTGNKVADLGHCFMAINPEAFASGSKERLSALLKQLRNLPAAGEKPVLIAGDPERLHMKQVDREGGITYHPNQLKASEEFAEHMSVRPMKLVPKSV
ncbi:Malate dehydrogenase [Camponotus japonicus]